MMEQKNSPPSEIIDQRYGVTWIFMKTVDEAVDFEMIRNEHEMKFASESRGGTRTKYNCSKKLKEECPFRMLVQLSDDGQSFHIYSTNQHNHPLLPVEDQKEATATENESAKSPQGPEHEILNKSSGPPKDIPNLVVNRKRKFNENEKLEGKPQEEEDAITKNKRKNWREVKTICAGQPNLDMIAREYNVETKEREEKRILLSCRESAEKNCDFRMQLINDGQNWKLFARFQHSHQLSPLNEGGRRGGAEQGEDKKKAGSSKQMKERKKGDKKEEEEDMMKATGKGTEQKKDEYRKKAASAEKEEKTAGIAEREEERKGGGGEHKEEEKKKVEDAEQEDGSKKKEANIGQVKTEKKAECTTKANEAATTSGSNTNFALLDFQQNVELLATALELNLRVDMGCLIISSARHPGRLLVLADEGKFVQVSEFAENRHTGKSQNWPKSGLKQLLRAVHCSCQNYFSIGPKRAKVKEEVMKVDEEK